MTALENGIKTEAGTASSTTVQDPEKDKALANSSVTNSEDTRLIKSRIFVGNLPADLRTDKGEVYDKFRKHGRIMGVSIHSRFAFVQFENETDAKTAVKEENHSDFRSAKLEIKMAIEGRTTNNNRNREDRERRRSRSPVDRRRRDSRDRENRDRRDSRDRRGTSRDAFRGRAHSRTASPSAYVPSPIEERFCHPRTYGANDVELVVIRKQQGQYADSILRRLYECRISANMLFLAEHAALDGAVNEFGRCGTHYVIIIMPKHEETRALTINMFEGQEKPREYRNLNIEEGVALINRHFNEHYPALARLRTAEIQGPNFYPPAPVEVTRTLTRMAEMSAVPTSSLDSTIRYLQEMRERTAAFEGLAPQPVVAAPFPQRANELDTGIGKPYSGIDERSRQMAASSESDNIRDSLMGLLKATGLSGGVPGVQLPLATQAAYTAGGGDYRNYASYPGVGPAYPASSVTSQALASHAGLAGLAADPVALQKALASLGVLGQNQLGASAVPTHGGQSQQNQQPQQQSQREAQSASSLASAYRTSGSVQQQQQQQQAHAQQSHAEENGSGGYSSQQQQGQQGVAQQSSMDRSGAGQYGGGGGQASHAVSQQQQYAGGMTAAQAASMRSVQVGQGGQASLGASNGMQQAGQPGSLYVTTGGAGSAQQYMQPTQQLQRAMQQQQQQAQQTGYGGGSRR